MEPSERSDFALARKEVVWRYQGGVPSLLVFLVKVQGSRTFGELLRHYGGQTVELGSFRGEYACGRVGEILTYLAELERSRKLPVIFCLDKAFFMNVRQTIASGFPINWRMVDAEAARSLRLHGEAAKAAIALGERMILAERRGLRSLRPEEGM